MRALVRSELLKQRTTRTTALLMLWMAGLLALVVLLHVFSLKTANLSPRDGQLKVLGWDTGIGALFASILGALSITAEFRHGTIRPTLLVTPKRARVVAAKLLASVLAGLAVGLLAEGFTAAWETAGLAARGIPSAGKFTPGAAAGAIAGAVQTADRSSLIAPALGLLLLAAYAVAAAGLGTRTMTRQDIT